jgi:hypothetical protein
MTAVPKGGMRCTRAIPSAGGFESGVVDLEVISVDKLGNAGVAGGTIDVVMP